MNAEDQRKKKVLERLFRELTLLRDKNFTGKIEISFQSGKVKKVDKKEKFLNC